MKKKVLISIAILFALHALTWWFWGKERLLIQAHEIMKNELNCEATTSFLDDGYTIIPVFSSDQVRNQTVIERDTILTTEKWRTLFESYKSDTSVVFRLHELNIYNSNPYITANQVQCTEFYYGDGFDNQWFFTTWFFFDWIKITDGHKYQMLTNKDYRDRYTF